MSVLLLLALAGNWDVKVAVADAVVTVQQRPELPNDVKPNDALAQVPVPEPVLGKPEPVNPKVTFIETDAEPLVITLVTTKNCAPCEQAKRELRAHKFGRPVVVFIRKGTEGVFPRVIFTAGPYPPRMYEGWHGIADFLGRVAKVEAGQ